LPVKPAFDLTKREPLGQLREIQAADADVGVKLGHEAEKILNAQIPDLYVSVEHAHANQPADREAARLPAPTLDAAAQLAAHGRPAELLREVGHGNRRELAAHRYLHAGAPGIHRLEALDVHH